MKAARLLALALTALMVALGAASAQGDAPLSLNAGQKTITVDGDPSDWVGITGLSLTMIDIAGANRQVIADVRVAYDDTNVYLLFQVHDDYNFDPNDHELSASLAVQWAIDAGAGPHMGTDGEDIATSQGRVDLWHWELENEPTPISGVVAGGQETQEKTGDDQLNCDDEFADTPFFRKDDGDSADGDNPDAENSLQCAWGHTAGNDQDAPGVYTFEFSRPSNTGDRQDAQFAVGEVAKLALVYFDADETDEGWTDSGHLQSADLGWIEVQF